MDNDGSIIYVETEDLYKDISNYVNKWFDNSHYSKDINRLLEKGKNKKVISRFKDEVGGLVMSKFCAHRARSYAFLIDRFTDYDFEKRGIINKKAKGIKKCVMKNKITFNDSVNVPFSGINLLRSQYSFRSRFHEIYTEKINKIALSSNDDKRTQSIDKITRYPDGYCDNSVIIENINDNMENTNDTSIIIENINDNMENTNDTSIIIENINDNMENTNDTSIIIENTNDTLINIENINDNTDDTNDPYVNIENNNDISKNTNDISISNENTNANSEIEIIKKEAQAIRKTSKLLREESKAIRNSSSNIRNELEIIKKETRNI